MPSNNNAIEALNIEEIFHLQRKTMEGTQMRKQMKEENINPRLPFFIHSTI